MATTSTTRRAGDERKGRGAGGRTGPREAWSFPLLVFAVHWLLTQVPASLAFLLGTPNAPSPPYGQMPPSLTGLARVVVEPMRQWDGLWYRLLAVDGYAGRTASAKAAFWPLYPWLMGTGSRLTGLAPETVGYVVSNVAFALALVVVYRLVALDFSEPAARGTLWALALFPTAFFFTAVYTESLFLALAAGALWAARTGRWWLAGPLGLLAALTRSSGVFLVVPFALLVWERARWDLRRWLPAAVPLLMPLLGPVLFGWHLLQTQGNPKAFVDVQAQWNRYSAMPWTTLRCAVEGCFALGGEPDGARWDWAPALLREPALVTDHAWRLAVANSDTLELVTTVLFLLLALAGLRLLPWWQSGYVLPPLLVPLFSPSQVHALMSMPRFVLPLFPLFTVLAVALARTRLARPAAVLSGVLLVLLTMQFALWYWVS